MGNEVEKNLLKRLKILERKLERCEQGRKLTEQAKDHYDLIYRSIIKKLDEQKKLLDTKNRELELLKSEMTVKNQELKLLTITDTLTKIYNRRKINEKLGEEFLQAKRYGLKFAVILMDVDWFKTINDNYGHQVGDYVLYDIAQIMKNCLRDTDNIGRWGGEEFLAVLPNTNAEEGYLLAERMRNMIGDYRFEKNKHLTCSFGVTEYEDQDSVEELVKRADDALYLAKKDRNASRIIKKVGTA